MRACVALVLLLSLLPVSSAASAESFLTIKGFVVSRSDQVLTVRNGGGIIARVIIGPATAVTGLRGSADAIGVNDLIRAEGISAPDHGVQATLIDVVLAGEGLAMGRRNGNGKTTILLNWIMNGKLTIDLP
jgi:hypothetical protein